MENIVKSTIRQKPKTRRYGWTAPFIVPKNEVPIIQAILADLKGKGYEIGESTKPRDKVIETIDWLLDYLEPPGRDVQNGDGKWVIVASNNYKALEEFKQTFPPAYALEFFRTVHPASRDLVRKYSQVEWSEIALESFPQGIHAFENSGLILFEDLVNDRGKITKFSGSVDTIFSKWARSWISFVGTIYVDNWNAHSLDKIEEDLKETWGKSTAARIFEMCNTVKLMLFDEKKRPEVRK